VALLQSRVPLHTRNPPPSHPSPWQRWAGGNGPDDVLSYGQIAFAGGFSALPTTAVMTPGERIKVLLQIQGQNAEKGVPPKYKGSLDVVKSLYREGGLASLYRGTVATLLRDVPGSIAYFVGYEWIKKVLTPAGAKASDLSVPTVLFAGGMAGVFNWTVAIPPDVLKSRLQSAPEGMYKGVGDVLSKLLKEEGPSALFRGLGPAMVRAFPANAACFLGIETSRKVLDLIL
jgi:solute carrier family 25 carnitine/acylcarnitine transporter 20/29